MTYIELIRAALRDTGLAAYDHLAVDDADVFDSLSPYEDAIRAFVNQAWLRIQESQNWRFNRLTFEIQLTGGTREYAPVDMVDSEGYPSIPAHPNADGTPALDEHGHRLAATGVRRWFRTALDGESAWSMTDLGPPQGSGGGETYPGPAAYGGYIDVMPFSEFHRLYMTRPAGQITAGKPRRITFRDEEPKSLVVFPTPEGDAAGRYLLYGQCQRQSQELVGPHDVPFGLPAEYHHLIKWQAIMLAQAHDQDGEAYQLAKTSYDEIRRDVSGDLVPAWSIGQSLAGSEIGALRGRYRSFAEI